MKSYIFKIDMKTGKQNLVKNLSTRIDSSLFHEVKVHAAKKGCLISKIVETALSDYLKKEASNDD